ncbi:polyphosphate polymerase domain-containing protein [Bdellovibrio bacteriovorus]|uniref:polyphosphate polymerase domain-containing protein n=1 Tax=Bdellovibrio bacteriovorus TaxID=959 RepID=UPI0009BD471D|nr:polyphosphate polymerase domain-containing protein [Bdellovibrio bacteriovorus]
MSVKPVSPLVLERYELKYLIPFSMVEPISRYVESFCDLDYYSQISHDGFYTINSLYFETPSFYFLRHKDNQTGRYSLRVRSYGDQPKAPYYFETKEKIGDFSKKRRGKVPIENWGEIITDPSKPQSFDPEEDTHLQYFLGLTRTYGANPTILTQYRRKAYISNIDDYARVTFDRFMRYREETEYNVNPAAAPMLNYDHPGAFGQPGMNVVLELKCERKIPVWIVDLIRRFNLVRGGFSKFEGSMKECFSIDHAGEFVLGRIPHFGPY